MKDKPVKDLPKAKYIGSLNIGEMVLKCIVLENGERILQQGSVFKAFGRPARGNRAQDPYIEIDGIQIQLPSFLASNAIKPLITKEVFSVIQSVEYLEGEAVLKGYKSDILPTICNLYLEARRKKLLKNTQFFLAEQSEILLSSFAKVGLNALIDEVTGYQYDRKHDALRILLEKYIAEGLQKWIKTFPDNFFAELDRLYNNATTTSKNRPQYYGKFINSYIYEPLENGYIKQELNRLNIAEDGVRKAKFHQWLSNDGKEVLMRQLYRILGIMEISRNINIFKSRINKQKSISIAPYLFEELNEID